MRAVWRLLPPELKQRIDGAAAIHSYAASRDRIHPGLMTAEERRALPPVCHPMIRVNRKTGERALFIGSHVSHIQGMPTGESRGLLDTLMDFATAERFIYRHCWRQHDLILWDNRAVIHRGRPWDMGHHPRHLVHVSVMDDELPPQPADGPAA